MNDEQIIKAANDLLQSLPVVETYRCPDNPHARSCHLRWMCGEILEFVAAGRREKAMRWLGFVQGAMWARGDISVEEAKRQNMPDGAEFDRERI